MEENKHVLSTDRLLIRFTNLHDADFIFKLMNSPKYLQFIGDKQVHTVGKAAAYIRLKMEPHVKEYGYGNYTVIRKSDQKKMGSCGLYRRVGIAGVDLGFAFLPEFESQGFAFEACTRVMKAAFERYGIEELRAYTSQENIASQNLLSRLGFVRDGEMQFPEEQEILLAFKTNLTPLV